MKNLTKIALILAIICVSTVSAFAQQVKGTVKDKAGEPVVGATVIIDGTSIGTTTALDGSFAINAKEGSVLVVSYIGYTTQNVAVEGKTFFDILLEEDIQGLDEVVCRLWYSEEECRYGSYLIYHIRRPEGSVEHTYRERSSGYDLGCNSNRSFGCS